MIGRDEVARLDELRRYELFEGADVDLDRLAELAARVTDTPIAIVSFIDDKTQRFLARFGTPPGLTEVPLSQSVCVRALDHPASVMVIENLLDEKYDGLDVVRSLDLSFYAGAPLVTPGGYTLGTVCVFDRRQRTLDGDERRALGLVRDDAMQVLETRRELGELRRSEGLRQEAVEALVATQHDLQHRVELRTREVEEAHKKTRQLLERIGDAFVALDRDWRYVYANERAAQLFSRTPDQLIGKQIWEEFPEGRGQPFHRAYEQAMREQVMITLEAEYQPWGRWFENRIYPSADGIAVFFTEITDRKRAEAELARTNARLVEAQRVAHVGSWEWDIAANAVSWSEELYRIYGLPVGSALGGYEAFLERVHPDDLAATKQVIGGAMGAGTATPFIYDHRIVRPDGSVRMLHTRGEVVVERGRPARLVGCCWDITELHETTRALERTVALLEATLEMTSDGLLVVDSGGKVASHNAQLAALFALPATQRPSSLTVLAEQLREPEKLLARARTIGTREESLDVVTLRDGRVLEARSRPHLVAGEVAGRVWSFRPAAHA
jgi:PAS domain S-box-containing protein